MDFLRPAHRVSQVTKYAIKYDFVIAALLENSEVRVLLMLLAHSRMARSCSGATLPFGKATNSTMHLKA
jgi:hypothetical protein